MSKIQINISRKFERVVVLVDMDCFYCQVEEKLDPSLKGKPIAVCQYNSWMGGGIIAVNYAARDRGVTRHMRGDEAKKHCPDIELVKVPSIREKADLSKYRDAGKEVAAVLQTYTGLLERASVDEAYLDITDRVMDRLKQMNDGNFSLSADKLENTFAVGYEYIGEFVKKISEPGEDDGVDEELNEDDPEIIKTSNIKMLIGASIANEIRAGVKEKTGYECSAGIAHNKILAKLVCGRNKPNKQTILPLNEIPKLFATLPVGKVTGLGGKFGEIVCESLKIKYMGDLVKFSERDLQNRFDEKNGSWLYLLARGINLEAVTSRYTSKSIGCCKNFPGKNAITGIKTLIHWLNELASEINDRLEKDLVENSRRAKLLTVSFMQTINNEEVSSSRSIPLDSYEKEKMAADAFECLKKNTRQFLSSDNTSTLNNAIKFLGLSVSKFEKEIVKRNMIQEMFQKQKTVPENQYVAKEESSTKCFQESNDLSEPIIDKENDQKSTTKPSSAKVGFFQKHFANKTKPDTPSPTEQQNSAEDNKKPPQQVEQLPPDLSAQPSTSGLQIRTIDNINSSVVLETNESKRFSSEISEGETTTAVSTEEQAKEIKLTPEYTKVYAEFYNQALNLEEFMKVCEQCKKKVSSFEYESHLDYHFALNLSHQQRQEFRRNIKTKPATPKSSPSPKVKKNEVPTVSISSFFKKETVDAVLPPPGELEICSECKKPVPLESFVEHSDYHAAKKLQMELNRTRIIPVVTKVVPKANTPARKTKLNKKQSISKFFSQNT